jgi:hypothetical protein
MWRAIFPSIWKVKVLKFCKDLGGLQAGNVLPDQAAQGSGD